MRTTFTPAPDIESKLRALARKKNASMNQVVNELLRTALQGDGQMVPREPFTVEARPMELLPGIDPLKLRDVLFQLESDER